MDNANSDRKNTHQQWCEGNIEEHVRRISTVEANQGNIYKRLERIDTTNDSIHKLASNVEVIAVAMVRMQEDIKDVQLDLKESMHVKNSVKLVNQKVDQVLDEVGCVRDSVGDIDCRVEVLEDLPDKKEAKSFRSFKRWVLLSAGGIIVSLITALTFIILAIK